MREMKLKAGFFLAVAVFSAGSLQAQDLLSKRGYQEPPEQIKKIVLAPRHENISLTNLSPDRKYFLNSIGDGLVPVERLGLPYMNLGGVQIDTVANRARSMNTSSSVGFRLIPAAGGPELKIETPANARVSAPDWSPDGKQIAYYAHFKEGTYIYVANVATGKSVRVTARPVLATLNTSFEWSGDGKYILTVLIPEKRITKPKPYIHEDRLRVRLSAKGKNQLRTVRHLLEDPYEEALFEYYCTGQIVKISVANPKNIRLVGKPGLFSSISLSPDGNYLLVTTVTKPFSNIVPTSSFGNVNELWDIDGKVLSEITKRELREGTISPTGTRPNQDPTADNAVQDTSKVPQKRSVRWRPDGQGISYMIQDPAPVRKATDSTAAPADTVRSRRNQPKRLDKVIQWTPPYGEKDIKVLYQSETLIASLDYSKDCQMLFMTESASGQSHLFAVDLSEPLKKYTIYKYRSTDFYTNPGSLMSEINEARGERGDRVILLSSDKSSVYLSGTLYHKEWKEKAPQPFIDRFNIKTGEKTRVFEGSPSNYERVIAVLDNDLNKIIITREAPTVVSNSFLKDIKSGQEVKLTNNIDYSPEITNGQYHIIDIERNDGIKFMAKVILPQNWNGEKLPAMFWFYPSEFTDQESIDKGKRSTNINSFRSTGVRSMENLITLGYAVILPDFPIVGTTGRMNDNYVPDLQKNWAAIIDAVVDRGFVDRNRLSLGGHSYGAFSTANSMVYTPYFKAGIAGDGAYNRLLTPMTFQTERRTLWEARETYLEMSPILYADRLNGALLMYHGGDDNNVGTWQINSERMFMALDGLDKVAALYIYPYEDHGPIARETQLDMWARWVEWLDRYVKNPVKK